MTRSVCESDMLPAVRRLFPASRFTRHTEVPLASKWIDFCALPRDDEELPVAVEMKVEKWRRALWQAITYRQVFALAYVAIWYESAHRVNRDLFGMAGVGLIRVTKSGAEIILEATPSPHYTLERMQSLMNWPDGGPRRG